MHPDIEIDSDEIITVGRSPLTGLRDDLVSRQHLKLKADFNQKRLNFEVIGTNPSTLNGEQLEHNKSYTAKHGDIIEMIEYKYPYKVHFDDVDDDTTDENVTKNGSTVDTTAAVADRSKDDEERISILSSGSVMSATKRRNEEENMKEPKKRRNEMSEDVCERVSQKTSSSMSDEVPLNRVKSKLNFVRDKAPFGDTDAWHSYNKGQMYVFTTADCLAEKKIAAYDMDGTLIKTKSGKAFATSIDDWEQAFGSVKSRLRKESADKFKIVVFTNQGGLATGKTTMPNLRKKIENIVKFFGVPMQVFIATDVSQFRKPLTMMWDALSDIMNNGIVIDKSKSFFVGDAAGRPEDKKMKRKKDHSCVDRLFALNLNLPFSTPEEHFLGYAKQPWKKPEFEPRDVVNSKPDSLLEPAKTRLKSNSIEVIIMVGGPGSGKSTFCHNHLKSQGYEVVNRDTLRTWQKCANMCEEHLTAGKSVVIDNTNGKREERAHYIKLAKKYGAICRCFVMSTTFSHAEHNVIFRQLLNPSYPKIAKVVLNTYKKNYVKPTKVEGFAEIVTVNFVPKFQDEREKALYGMYILES